jgi:hypothetical protein
MKMDMVMATLGHSWNIVRQQVREFKDDPARKTEYATACRHLVQIKKAGDLCMDFEKKEEAEKAGKEEVV